MLQTFITIIVIVAVIVLWAISTKRRLVMLDENISSTMYQVGVQMSSRFDILSALLDLTKEYMRQESGKLMKTINSRRSISTTNLTPDDVLCQEGIISDALDRVAIITEQYPELKENQTYSKAMDALQTLETMVRTSRLIYNDSVAKLNREIRMFPVSMIAGIMGFRQREYLVEQEGKADLPRL